MFCYHNFCQIVNTLRSFLSVTLIEFPTISKDDSFPYKLGFESSFIIIFMFVTASLYLLFIGNTNNTTNFEGSPANYQIMIYFKFLFLFSSYCNTSIIFENNPLNALSASRLNFEAHILSVNCDLLKA